MLQGPTNTAKTLQGAVDFQVTLKQFLKRNFKYIPMKYFSGVIAHLNSCPHIVQVNQERVMSI